MITFDVVITIAITSIINSGFTALTTFFLYKYILRHLGDDKHKT